MGFLKIYRLIIFVLCTILSIPVLALVGDLTKLTNEVDVTQSWEIMGLLVASVSLLVFPLLLIISWTRKNAFVLYVVSEFAIIGLLWVLWVVAAALTIEKKNDLLQGFSCSVFIFSETRQKCNELVSSQGLEIVVFVLLLKYLLVLFIYTLIIYLRDGNGQVWFQTVEDLQGPALPALTHKSGDLESSVAPSSVPMNTYTAGTPVTYNTPAHTGAQ